MKRMDALTTPSNWQRVRLGDIAEIKRGASPRPIENPKWFCANSNVGWVRISDISKNSRFLYKTAQKLSKKGIEKSRFIKQNSLIMSMCATIGKPIITKIDTCIHDGFVVFENPKIDLNYLYYFLCYIEKEWLESGQQGSQVNLNVDLIKNKEVFCPKNLNEQIAIANVLSDVDRYLYNLDALILKKESVKKALSFELLSQRKRLKGFNQAWQKVRLGDIAEINPPTIIPNVFYYIDLESVEKGQLLNKQLMTKNKAPSRARRLLSKNDILYQLVRPYQRNNYFFTLNGNYVASTGYAQIRTLQNPSFLYFALHSNYFVNAVLDRCEGTSYPAISSNELKKCEVILPPLNEQIAIANILSALDSEIISLKNKKRQFDNIKKALNHDLMSAKIRVLKK
ncbi:restriction endonuclease subunit S [Helicobacter pylori]